MQNGYLRDFNDIIYWNLNLIIEMFSYMKIIVYSDEQLKKIHR